MSEHIQQSRSNKTQQKSHVFAHWRDQTQFKFEVIKFSWTPLSHQVSEAIALELANRRGEVVLNNKEEYSRCYIAVEDIADRMIMEEEQVSLKRNQEYCQDQPIAKRTMLNNKR